MSQQATAYIPPYINVPEKPMQTPQSVVATAPLGNSQISEHDLLILVELNGQKRAYLTTALEQTHVVNDTVGGCPIAVTW